MEDKLSDRCLSVIIEYCSMCRKEAGRVKCKECKYCKQIGRTEEYGFRGSRKTYYCENPEVYKLKDKHGYPINNFIGYGDTTTESPLQIKTTKRWCPLEESER